MKYKTQAVIVMVSLSAIAGLASAVSVGGRSAVLTGETAVLQFNGMGDYRNANYAYNPDHKGKYKETGSTYAGELKYTVDGEPGSIMWCVDIYQNTSSSKVTYDAALLTDSNYLLALDTLYYQYSQYIAANSNSASKLDDAASAFQMSLWEITFETSEYNLDNGWFKVSSTSTANSLGNEWLASLDDVTAPEYQKTVWYDSKYQDVIQFGDIIPVPPVGNVPEPLTMLSMAVAISAAGRYAVKRFKTA